MADQAVVHIGENSPEQVAYKLLVHVAQCEDKHISASRQNGNNVDRQWLLDTYAECLLTVQSPGSRVKKA